MQKTFSGLTVKAADLGQVSAVFSTFNVVDHDGDVTLPGAIKDGTEVVISAYGHSSHWEKLPVGKGVIRTTDTEAILEGQFFMDTTHGKDTFNTVKGLGPLGEWSYSLQDVSSKSGEIDGQAVTYLENIGRIKEVSPVLMGAGINTRTLGTKSLKFSEEGEAVLADLDAFLGRASEVMVLRSAKGRSLGAESVDLLGRLDETLVKLRGLLDVSDLGDVDAPSAEDLDALKAIRTDLLRNTLFRNVAQGA